jgi:hypothetical protein
LFNFCASKGAMPLVGDELAPPVLDDHDNHRRLTGGGGRRKGEEHVAMTLPVGPGVDTAPALAVAHRRPERALGERVALGEAARLRLKIKNHC